jgi:hypothetical protein
MASVISGEQVMGDGGAGPAHAPALASSVSTDLESLAAAFDGLPIRHFMDERYLYPLISRVLLVLSCFLPTVSISLHFRLDVCCLSPSSVFRTKLLT